MQVSDKLIKPLTEAKYLNADNVSRYRCIMRIFFEHYEKLKYWLYQEEVYEEMIQDPLFADYRPEQCQQDLTMLTGNPHAFDNGTAARNFLYQMIQMDLFAKSGIQKLKLYRLAQIMLENTDDEHYITMPEIMEELGKYEVTADRKTIYADLRDLSVLGIEVEGEPIGNRYHYRVVNRPFELPELKLLVDSIQSSKFITEKKTNTLIKKLEKLVSKYDAQRLQRQVYVSGRIKTMNESIYYTVDAIHNAISENKKIKFQYFQWNVKKEMELRHGGAWYHISPWGLSWDDENYYMIGYDAEAQMIKHYRVDKMLHIRMSGESREGKEHFKKLDMADYAKKSFGMFRGKETSVKMLVNNSLAGVIIDRFGKDVMMIPEDEDHFRVNVDVHVSKQFLGWVFSLGEAVKIIGPDEVVEQMRGEARRLMEQYGE